MLTCVKMFGIYHRDPKRSLHTETLQGGGPRFPDSKVGHMVSPQAFLCYFWMKESRKRYTVWEFTGILGKWHSIYKFGTDSKNNRAVGFIWSFITHIFIKGLPTPDELLV